MPPKITATEESKTGKTNGQTLIDPTPYETNDVSTSIVLLLSPEKDVVVRALNLISAYAEKSDYNVEILYKNGIMFPLLELIVYSDLTILRFALKLIGMIVTTVDAAAEEFLHRNYFEQILKISYIFITFADQSITEFANQILGRIVRSQPILSQVLQTEIIAKIFDVLQNSEDADCQLNTLLLLSSLLDAKEAREIFPFVPQISPKTLLCYLKHDIIELRRTAFSIINKMIAWRSSIMQEILRAEQIVEVMFNIIMTDENKAFHKAAFEAICNCIKCVETASYFVKSLEFVSFSEWAKSCKTKYILPTVSLLGTLTRTPSLRQILFDFSFEDTLLSFFRDRNAETFIKTCVALRNMALHRYCCEKLINSVMIEHLLEGIVRDDLKAVPYQEVAIQTLYALVKRNAETIDIIVDRGGINPITKCIQKNWDNYTSEAQDTLLNILYIFSCKSMYQDKIMNLDIFQMLLDTFVSEKTSSHLALCILSQYSGSSEYRHFFIGFDGPNKVLTKLITTKSAKMFKNVLVYLKRLFIYKKIGMEFLSKGAVGILSNLDDEIKTEFPSINEILHLMYNLYLPTKFHELGRLETSDILSNGFYLMNSLWAKELTFLDVRKILNASLENVVYIVDFSGEIDEPIPKSMNLPILKSQVESGKSFTTRKNASSMMRNSATSNPLVAPKLPGTRTTLSSTGVDLTTIMITPFIKTGCIPEDPCLSKYVEELRNLIKNDNRILCYDHQVNATAHFVNDILVETDSAEATINEEYYGLYLATLIQKLGTSVIPIGFLRCGRYCERALLFKALADKVGIPATLVRGKNVIHGELRYWNEVPLVVESKYKNINDEQLAHLSYAVVDLLHDIGKLYLTGTVEANKYCGIPN